MEPIMLTKIPVTGLEIHQQVDFDASYYKKTDILKLQNVYVNGSIKKNLNQDIYLDCQVAGTMMIPDARTLEPISHSFAFEIHERLDETNEQISEYLEKDKNILDIMGILWENIVLEVPIRKTTSENEVKQGDGWELVSEKTESMDPRLAPLRKLLDSEKE